MFSPHIVGSEEFLSMPASSQLLYFHLGMEADDDGFVQPQRTMRVIGSTGDDLKVLLAKRFLLTFESGVVVIKHWLIHNLIQKDRYHPTRFEEEKKRLYIKENKAYTDNPDSVNKMLPEVRLSKDRLELSANAESEMTIEPTDSEGNSLVRGNDKPVRKTTPEMKAVFAIFADNPDRFMWKLRAVEREASAILHKEFGIDELSRRYEIVKKYRSDPLCPQINKPSDFLSKMPKMEKFLQTV
jgi:hypothetical protein